MVRNKQTEQKELMEQRHHSSVTVPYSLYNCRLPEAFPTVPMHWHSELELDVVTEGKGEFICGDIHFPVESGDVVLIQPNMLHAAYPDKEEGLKYRAFVFHANMVGAEQTDRSSFSYIKPLRNGQLQVKPKYGREDADYPKVKELAEDLIALAECNDAYHDLFLKSRLFALLYFFEKKENISERGQQTGNSELIRPALEYMTFHYEETISVDYLAGICAISISHFMNTFQKVVGCSAIEYLIHLRIQAACAALTDTTENVAEIATGCGYNNLSNFNRQFKKMTGVSPKAYRRQMAETGSRLDIQNNGPAKMNSRLDEQNNGPVKMNSRLDEQNRGLAETGGKSELTKERK